MNLPLVIISLAHFIHMKLWRKNRELFSNSVYITGNYRLIKDYVSILNDSKDADKKNQLDVTCCIFYFSSNSCSTCFGQPCAHHQELTTAWYYSLLLVWQPSRSHGTYQHEAIISRSRQLLKMGTWLPETCWATIRREIKNTKSDI